MTVIGLLLGIIGVIPLPWRDRADEQVGVLKPRGESLRPSIDDFHGGVQMNQGTGAITVRMEEGAIVQPFGRYAPLSMTSREGGILISAIVQSLDGRIVAKIQNNEWVLNPKNYFRRNFDKSALEVIDEYDTPVLQVDYIDPNSLRIGGILRLEERETSELYPDFPSTPKSDNPRAVYSFRGVIMVLGKHGFLTIARDSSPADLRAATVKVGLSPWFDYSRPKRLGLRKE
jgi:hypothetical protein